MNFRRFKNLRALNLDPSVDSVSIFLRFWDLILQKRQLSSKAFLSLVKISILIPIKIWWISDDFRFCIFKNIGKIKYNFLCQKKVFSISNFALLPRVFFADFKRFSQFFNLYLQKISFSRIFVTSKKYESKMHVEFSKKLADVINICYRAHGIQTLRRNYLNLLECLKKFVNFV